jgi:hypothetical protein
MGYKDKDYSVAQDNMAKASCTRANLSYLMEAGNSRWPLNFIFLRIKIKIVKVPCQVKSKEDTTLST